MRGTSGQCQEGPADFSACCVATVQTELGSPIGCLLQTLGEELLSWAGQLFLVKSWHRQGPRRPGQPRRLGSARPGPSQRLSEKCLHQEDVHQELARGPSSLPAMLQRLEPELPQPGLGGGASGPPCFSSWTSAEAVPANTADLGRSGKNLAALGAEPLSMRNLGEPVDWSGRVQTLLTRVERLCANISSPDTEGCDRRLPAVHLGLSDKCARTCEGAARKMRPEPSRIGPGRRTSRPRPGVRALPTHSPASPGASSLPSRGKRCLRSPARPFLALLLLLSVKQVRAVFIIIVVIIISGTFFLIAEAI